MHRMYAHTRTHAARTDPSIQHAHTYIHMPIYKCTYRTKEYETRYVWALEGGLKSSSEVLSLPPSYASVHHYYYLYYLLRLRSCQVRAAGLCILAYYGPVSSYAGVHHYYYLYS